MRSYKFYIAFMLAWNTYSQNDSIPDYTKVQIDIFKRAEKNLSLKNLNQAAENYRSVQVFYPDSDISKISARKLDSIIPIIRKQSLQSWIGTWKLKKLYENYYQEMIPDIIVITDEEIEFHRQDLEGNRKLMRSEKINYALPRAYVLEFDFCDLTFENKQVWRFERVKRKREERLLLQIVSPEEGTYIHTIYEGWNTSKKEMKKFKEEEYYTTFYVRE